MARREWNWTQHQLDKLDKVKVILVELEGYKPLTLRQVYYQMVGKGFIENTVSQYGMLSNLIKWARIDGHISWDDIEDRGRTFHDESGWDDKDNFTMQVSKYFLTGYRRDLLQTQDKYIEIWIEKDALSSIFTKIASPYTVSVVVNRGFTSISFLHDFQKRIDDHKGKDVVMLYFGDFDPSGMEMLDAMKTTLQDELGINGVTYKRIALLEQDISKYKLPHNPDALKKTDTRAEKHIKAYGEIAVELDALRPDVLERKIKKAIEAELDIDTFNKEVGKYNSELKKLSILKGKVDAYIKKIL